MANAGSNAEEVMLFTERSIWTMLHGIAFGGGALLALAAALFAFYLMYPRSGEDVTAPDRSRAIAGVTTIAAGALWLTALVGTPPRPRGPPNSHNTRAR
jgi:hypothetical protein